MLQLAFVDAIFATMICFASSRGSSDSDRQVHVSCVVMYFSKVNSVRLYSRKLRWREVYLEVPLLLGFQLLKCKLRIKACMHEA